MFYLPLTVARCEMFLDCSFTYVKIAFMLLIRVADSSDFLRVGTPFFIPSAAPRGDRTSCVLLGSGFLKKVFGLDSGLDSLDFMVVYFGLLSALGGVSMLAGSSFMEAVCRLSSGRF